MLIGKFMAYDSSQYILIAIARQWFSCFSS